MKTVLSAKFNVCWHMAEAVAKSRKAINEPAIQFSVDGNGEAVLIGCTEKDEAYIEVHLPKDAVEPTEPGSALLPTDRIGAFLDRLFAMNMPVSLNTNDATQKGTIKAGSSRFGFTVADAEKTPRKPSVEDSKLVFKAGIDEFFRCAKFGGIASDTKEKFPEYVCLEMFDVKDNGTVSVVSTDGKRLSLSDFKVTDSVGGEKFLIHVDSISLLNRLYSMIAPLMKSEGIPQEIEIWKTERSVIFKSAFFDFYVSYSTTNFPKFASLLQFDPVTTMKVDRKELISCIQRANIMLNATADVGSKRALLLETNADSNVLTIRTKNVNVGESNDAMDCEAEGQNIAVGFQPAYLLDGLESIPDKTVEFKFNGPEGACLICPAGEPVGEAADGTEAEKERSSGFVYLVMPVKKATMTVKSEFDAVPEVSTEEKNSPDVSE